MMLDTACIKQWWSLWVFGLCIAFAQSTSAQTITGDVDRDSVLTCHDLSAAKQGIGKRSGQAGYLPILDLDRNGVIDIRDIAAISRLLPAGTVCQGVFNYLVFLGHDGHPDPDDNLAQLAGWVVTQRHALEHPRVAIGGFVYCDTTNARKAGMLYPASNQDRTAKGNYVFHLLFGLPAMVSLGLDLAHYADECLEQYNFQPASIDDISAGGKLLFKAVKSAIDANGTDRVVFSAGGGHNAGAEAISLLRHDGYSDAQIFEHFAMVQHSAFNWNNVTEAAARTIAAPFSIRIQDQNPFSGIGFGPVSVDASCTSTQFVTAWNAARGGSAVTAIPNHNGTTDMSDAGSHSFATTPELLDANWNTRNNGLNLNGNPAAAVKYTAFSTPQANAYLNPPCFLQP